MVLGALFMEAVDATLIQKGFTSCEYVSNLGVIWGITLIQLAALLLVVITERRDRRILTSAIFDDLDLPEPKQRRRVF
jgi:hypothetical protein